MARVPDEVLSWGCMNENTVAVRCCGDFQPCSVLHQLQRSNPSALFIFPSFPSGLMTAYPVTPKMNKASFNEPDAIARLEQVIAA